MRSAAASAPAVAEAASDALRRGNAIDAIVTGVMVAAAASPGVLLGPVQILAAGPGMGFVTVDGRVQQPGRGAPRPRGFLPNERIPEGAYFGVPVLPAALAATLGSIGTWTFQRALEPARSFAKATALERLTILDVLAKSGAVGLARDPIAVELLAVGGRAAGGLLTRDDLAGARPLVRRPDETSVHRCWIMRFPWAADERDASAVQVVAAADSRGGFAIACYEMSTDGLPIPALGLEAPRCAVPVLRGQTRILPRTPNPAPAPMGIVVRSGRADAALGISGATHVQPMDAIFASLETAVSLPVKITKLAGGVPIWVRPQRRARSTP